MSVTLSRAARADLQDVLALLTAVGLPHDGVEARLDDFLVARADDHLIGCAGLERYGSLGLLRSVAVAPGAQGRGVGAQLVEELLEGAARAGIDEVVLLTTTARDFFARRFGFVEVGRAAYDRALAESIEWRLPRCASAVCMARRARRADPP